VTTVRLRQGWRPSSVETEWQLRVGKSQQLAGLGPYVKLYIRVEFRQVAPYRRNQFGEVTQTLARIT
jgi:hypothetical protein